MHKSTWQEQNDGHLTLLIVGGASGVGKTSLLRAVDDLPQPISTGTLFKDHMSLASRDDVRRGDWTACEADVVENLKAVVWESVRDNRLAVVDTHFAAKVHGSNYRIGLDRVLVFEFAKAAFKAAIDEGMRLSARVALIECDPYELFRRRRLDTTRDREPLPSDCYNDLRANRVCARQYLAELARARNSLSLCGEERVRYTAILNADFDKAARGLHEMAFGRS